MTTRKIETKYPGPATYRVAYSCENCGWSGTKTFDRGKTAYPTAECPKCGCMTAKKAVAVPYVPKRIPLPLPTPEPFDPWPRPSWDRPRLYCGLEERCENAKRRVPDFKVHSMVEKPWVPEERLQDSLPQLQFGNGVLR